MRTSDVDILLVPGPGTSENHWLQRWRRNLKTAILVNPPGAMTGFPAWVASIIAVAGARSRPTLIVAHGSGVAAAIAAADGLRHAKVVGALLVAPQMPDLSAHPGVDLKKPLGLPAALVASRSSPHHNFEELTAMAKSWHAELVDAGDAGAVDETSGHGPWPEGLMRLGWFLKRIASTKTQ